MSKEQQSAFLTKNLLEGLTGASLKFTHVPKDGAIQDVEVTTANGHVYGVRVLPAAYALSAKSPGVVTGETYLSVADVLAEVLRDSSPSAAHPPVPHRATGLRRERFSGAA
jgi:hypothetical protein